MSPSPDTIIVAYEEIVKIVILCFVGAVLLAAGLRWILKRFG